MPPQLLSLTGGPSLVLDKPIVLFGRDLECDVRFDSPKISRRHCCVAMVGNFLVVRDLGSTNGVRINGVRVTEGRLKPGDELTIGAHRYQVRWDVAAERGVKGQAATPRGVPVDPASYTQADVEPPRQGPEVPEPPTPPPDPDDDAPLAIPDDLKLGPAKDSGAAHEPT